MHGWLENGGDSWIAAGSYNKLYVYNAGGTQFDITPAGLTAGNEDAIQSTGYGSSYYGKEAYGVERQQLSAVVPATTWALDSFGQSCPP